MWNVTCKIGVYWDGPHYHVCVSRYLWFAMFRAKLHLIKYPYRTCYVKKGSMLNFRKYGQLLEQSQ